MYIYIYMYIYICICIIIILISFVIATILFILNVVGDLPDLQTLPQPCSIKNKTDSDNIEHNTYKFRTFSSFLLICKKCFTKLSYVVCFVHHSDIKSNWSQGIELVYPVQFFPSELLFVLNLVYQGDAPVSNIIMPI